MGKRKTVLIVDDSRATLDVLEGAFEEAGFAVAAAADGEEVFRKMAATNPDAVLLDTRTAIPATYRIGVWNPPGPQKSTELVTFTVN